MTQISAEPTVTVILLPFSHSHYVPSFCSLKCQAIWQQCSKNDFNPHEILMSTSQSKMHHCTAHPSFISMTIVFWCNPKHLAALFKRQVHHQIHKTWQPLCFSVNVDWGVLTVQLFLLSIEAFNESGSLSANVKRVQINEELMDWLASISKC